VARAPLTPMLATSGTLPTGQGWLYEFKWDGMRLVVDWDGDALRLWSRNGIEATESYPELAALAERLGPDPLVLDGEVVVLDEQNRPDFGLLQRRMHVRGAEARRLVAIHPVQLFCFDVLRTGRHELLDLPLQDRRRLLEALELQGPSWRVPPAFVDDGPVVLDTAKRLGLEGVIAKRLSSPYEPGRRSPNWRKVKLFLSDEFVVGGFSAGTGRREGSLGALLLGAFDAGGSFRFVGNVGSGFTDADLDSLRARLDPYVTGVDPFDGGPPRPAATFVEPDLVVDVAYSGWTRDGVLRHPSYRGVRPDRAAAEITLPPGAPGQSGP
jgi:bifunctional non-homologous end joining protein LigD